MRRATACPGCVLLKALPVEQRPRLVRGDIAFGVDPVMRELEDMEQAYLFKLRQSAGVKRLIERLWRHSDWQDMGDGYHAAETRLKLSGWEQERRVVVVRRAVRQSLAVEANADGTRTGQQTLQFAHVEAGKLWEYAVLVTNSDYPLAAIGQLYRDRADCENGFDELKNQWGWGGYTTQDLERCNLSARAVALIYNWWSWYVRLAHPKARLARVLTMFWQPRLSCPKPAAGRPWSATSSARSSRRDRKARGASACRRLSYLLEAANRGI
jgi:hypothetical protein